MGAVTPCTNQASWGGGGKKVGLSRHQTTPARLVARTNAGPVVTMEVLIKQ